MKLIKTQSNEVLLTDLTVAERFLQRLVGLIGKRDLEDTRGVLFPRCNSIHTFFMQMAIDVLYLDHDYCCVEIHESVEAGLVVPCRKSRKVHVLETREGWVRKHGIQTGDHFTVCD